MFLNEPIIVSAEISKTSQTGKEIKKHKKTSAGSAHPHRQEVPETGFITGV